MEKNYSNKAHTSNLDENIELLSINPSKAIESTQKLTKILVDNFLISKIEAKEIVTVKEIESYIVKLLDSWEISERQYINFYIKSWSIMLWEYLMYKWIISNDDHIKALQIQEKQNKKYWEILLEKWIIKDSQYFEYAVALKELWIIKLWEYYIWEWKLSPQQLKMYLKMQAVNHKSFWQLLIDFWITNQNELNNVLADLWITITYDEFWVDDTDWYYKLKEY